MIACELLFFIIVIAPCAVTQNSKNCADLHTKMLIIVRYTQAWLNEERIPSALLLCNTPS